MLLSSLLALPGGQCVPEVVSCPDAVCPGEGYAAKLHTPPLPTCLLTNAARSAVLPLLPTDLRRSFSYWTTQLRHLRPIPRSSWHSVCPRALDGMDVQELLGQSPRRTSWSSPNLCYDEPCCREDPELRAMGEQVPEFPRVEFPC